MIKVSYRPTLLFLLFAAGATVTGCSRPMPEPESKAFKLYEQKCNICHSLYSPRLLDKRTWALVVDRMEKKVLLTDMRAELTEKEKGLILNYLKKYSRERSM